MGLLIVLFILIITLIVVLAKSAKALIKEGFDSDYRIFSILVVLLSICLGGVIDAIKEHNKPKAIDVYRGKTMLEINQVVRDSTIVKCDTIVVFKNHTYTDTCTSVSISIKSR